MPNTYIRENDYSGSTAKTYDSYKVLVFGLDIGETVKEITTYSTHDEWSDALTKAFVDSETKKTVVEAFLNDLSTITVDQCLQMGMPVIYVPKTIWSDADFDFKAFVDKTKYDIRFIALGSNEVDVTAKYKFNDSSAYTLPEIALLIAAVRGECTALVNSDLMNPDLTTAASVDTYVNGSTVPVFKMCSTDINNTGIEVKIPNADWTRSELMGKYLANFNNKGTLNAYFPQITDDGAEKEPKVTAITWPLKLTDSPNYVGLSLWYLICFGYWVISSTTVRYNPWYSIAGVTRGKCPLTFTPVKKWGQAEVSVLEENYTPGHISTNICINVEEYGYVIWGNRTAYPMYSSDGTNGELTKSSFLNVRQLCSTIKKVAYKASLESKFDPNSTLTWYKYRSKVLPTLDKALNDNGCTSYSISPVTTSTKALMLANIDIVPVEGLEDVGITINLYSNDSELQTAESSN